MELGNMIFGNSRGQHPIKRGVGWEDEFQRLQDVLKMDYHCEEFETDVFSVFPYYWGDCTCGFDDREFDGEHGDQCYQSALEAERTKAGAMLGDWGYLDWPESWSWKKKQKVEDKIYHKLTAQYNLPMLGCAIHCTCDYGQRYELWLKEIDYPSGHKSTCLLVKPNFYHKPSDFQIQWYKYPFRDSYMSRKITLSEFSKIIDGCINYLQGNSEFTKRIKRIKQQEFRVNKRFKQWDDEGWLCHKCMRGLPLKNRKVICDMVERNWQGNEKVGILMLPDGTEIDWKKECESFLPWGDD